jgi:hypothetical protein
MKKQSLPYRTRTAMPTVGKNVERTPELCLYSGKRAGSFPELSIAVDGARDGRPVKQVFPVLSFVGR